MIKTKKLKPIETSDLTRIGRANDISIEKKSKCNNSLLLYFDTFNCKTYSIDRKRFKKEFLGIFVIFYYY